MNQEAPAPQFDPSSPFHTRPKLRPIRGFPVESEGRKMLGVSDSRQISDRMVVVPFEFGGVMPLIDGTRGIEEIAETFGQGLGVEHVEGLIAQLDHAGLLVSPVSDAMIAQMKAEFDAAETLPPAATAALTDLLVSRRVGEEATQEQKDSLAAEVLREALDGWIAQALEKEPDKKLTALPRAIMVPHLDYPRGGLSYAVVWGKLRGVARPDRIVILGTNHFGAGTGVTICDKGYETALGTSPVDTAFLAALRNRLGPEGAARAMEHRLDHEREHSIELQVPWIQHCLGPDAQGRHIPVLGILVHDPLVNQGESYDGKGLGLSPFVEALRLAMSDVGGTTLIVASADLSHTGPMFGDRVVLQGEEAVVRQFRGRVTAHDQAMLKLIGEAKADDLITAMSWQQNPTRWCSIGNIVATMKTIRPSTVRVLRYSVAIDPEGMAMVTCAGAIMD